MKDDEIKLLTGKLNESNKPIPQMTKEQNPLIGSFGSRRSSRGIKTTSNKGIKNN